MKRIVVFGNSGSGKSSLASALCAGEKLAHLDLDTLAWRPTPPPQRESSEISKKGIEDFIGNSPDWVIEGCYADLLAFAIPHATDVIFLDLPVETCLANARKRPWEPHKYDSKKAQDNNLPMLLDWIKDYYQRNDVCSQSSHRALFDAFSGNKQRHTEQ